MAAPTDVITAADVTAQAAIAASRMEDMLQNMQENLQPTSDIFTVPDVNDVLSTLDPNELYYNIGDFQSVYATLDELTSNYNAQLQVGAIPTPPALGITTSVDLPSAPALNATMPEVNIPSAPAVSITTTPTAPNIEDVQTPDAPIVAIPSVPELSEITLPSISTISIPLFTQTFPEVPDDLLAPDAEFFYEEEEYTSEELVALRDLLLDDLRNGGWGVNHTDEEALFDREVDRASSAGVTNEETTIETMASRGFHVPTGSLNALLRRNQQATLNEISTANREVSIQRADLIRKSRENVIASSLQLNQTMVTHFGFVQQRLLSAAQSTIDFALRAFNAQAESYNLRVQAYTAYVSAWEAQIRGQIAQLEAERTQLEAESKKIDLDRSRIDAYTAQVRAVALQIDIYNTEMQAASIRSDIERNKLAAFSSQVDAHRSSIQAEIAKIQAYTAQVNAEGTRVELYRTQVNAHESEVRSAKLSSDVQVQKAQIELEDQRAKLQAYESEIRGYTAQISAQTAAAEIAVAQADGMSRIAVAQGDLAASNAQSWISSNDSINRVNNDIANMRMIQQRNFSQHNIELMKARIDNFTKPAELWQDFYTSLGALASAVDVEIT